MLVYNSRLKVQSIETFTTMLDYNVLNLEKDNNYMDKYKDMLIKLIKLGHSTRCAYDNKKKRYVFIVNNRVINSYEEALECLKVNRLKRWDQ